MDIHNSFAPLVEIIVLIFKTILLDYYNLPM